MSLSLSEECQRNARAAVTASGFGDTRGLYAMLETLTPDELRRVAGLLARWCALLVARNREDPYGLLDYLRAETGGG